jgi:hypothetical protein
MARLYRGARAYNRAPKRGLRPQLVIPCLCGSTRWQVDLQAETARCLDCGSKFSKSFWHPESRPDPRT